MRSQKQTILQIVQTSREHMTADQVYLAAKATHPSLAIGTVYRNLALLAEEGLVRRIEVPGEPAHYDKTLRPHEHMVCIRCGKMLDVELRGDLLTYLRRETAQDVRSYHLSIMALCPACRAEATDK